MGITLWVMANEGRPLAGEDWDVARQDSGARGCEPPVREVDPAALVRCRQAAHDAAMQLVPTRLIAAIRRRIAGPSRSPEEILQRHADRLAAEARMRGEIDRAVKLWGRTSRHVR
jgi:hypothetical protein